MRILVVLSLCAPIALCFKGVPVVSSLRRQHTAFMTVASRDEPVVPILQLLEERKYRDFLRRAADKPSVMIELLQEAGLAGVVAYFIAFLIFYSVAGTVGELAYHAVSGNWLDPRVLLMEDGATGKAESLTLFASFYLACKPLAPLRLGGALILTPDVNTFIQARPAVATAAGAIESVWDGTVGAGFRAVAPVASVIKESPIAAPIRRELLKTELLDLAKDADGGVKSLTPEAQGRLEEIAVTLLPKLNPTAEPSRSEALSAEWECQWTNERGLNFARENGLFGLPWKRTYQRIDVTKGTLLNVLEFDDGQLTVGSMITPDETNAAKFNFAFSGCLLRWRSYEVPLPPVGRGWGELLFLDDELRIQRDIRGDLLIATKAR